MLQEQIKFETGIYTTPFAVTLILAISKNLNISSEKVLQDYKDWCFDETEHCFELIQSWDRYYTDYVESSNKAEYLANYKEVMQALLIPSVVHIVKSHMYDLKYYNHQANNHIEAIKHYERAMHLRGNAIACFNFLTFFGTSSPTVLRREEYIQQVLVD